MALGPHALVTLAEARARLSIDLADTTRDETISRLVDEVSIAVQNTLGRELRPAIDPDTDDAETRAFSVAPGRRIIDVTPYELVAIDSLTVEGVELDSTTYRLRRLGNKFGGYDSIALTGRLWCAPGGFAELDVEVSGWWGWAEIPADVKGWVLDLVSDRWTASYAQFANAYGQPSDDRGPVTIPYRIRDEMERYTRVRIGTA